MKYSIDKNEGYSIFKLEEENLNSLIAPELKSEFIFFYNEGVQSLILDMSDVKYVDSSGLSSLLTAERLWKQRGSFIMSNVDHSNVKKLIEISRLDSVFTVIPTISEAVDFVMIEKLEKDLQSEAD